MPSARVCLVTPGYISSSPRVVREADALTAAGYDVRVAFTQGQLLDVRTFDDALIERKPWRTSIFKWSRADSSERWAYYRSGVRHHVAQALTSRGVTSAPIVARAEGRVYPELTALATAERADLYIGHYPIGLAAAAAAATRHGALLGYDIEDLYAETFPPTPDWLPSRSRIMALEHRHARACAHLTAVSDLVADAFADRYATPRPIPVYNCHPWADRANLDNLVKERKGSALSLFWFSQTVGLDRGLQTAVEAAGLMRHPAQIHLRGSVDAGTRAALEDVARRAGVPDVLHFHPRCAPEELLSRAAEHDVGLALETDLSLNHRLTASNKIFLYFVAGLAVVASDVPGQRWVMERAPRAGLIAGHGDASSMARALDEWANDPLALAAAKQASLDAGRTRWNAEQEADRVVTSVTRALTTRAHRAASGE
jgi:glycosyltransferase involved in cell wall biosynthesis